jgi:CubicO group peptidase (beta-lactamase class C family)
MTEKEVILQHAFPLQAPVSIFSKQCSEKAPEWLHSMTRKGVNTLKALSTQTAFIGNDGRLHHCETGWLSAMFFSERVSKDALFRYGSLTKPVTALKVLSLINEGRIRLDSTLSDIFDLSEQEDSLGGYKGVTVAQLLSHRSGVEGGMFVEKTSPDCPSKVKSGLSRKALGDKKSKYSNIGYCVLGEIIASVLRVDYRQAMEESFGLSKRGIGYAEYETQVGEVSRDFRFNDFYGVNNKGRFDYQAISSTAGMMGSASAYASLLKGGLKRTRPDALIEDDCDQTVYKNCYGYVFYGYEPLPGVRYWIKEGYLPGAGGVVVINDENEVFVWLGNSDTENASKGEAMREFLRGLALSGF